MFLPKLIGMVQIHQAFYPKEIIAIQTCVLHCATSRTVSASIPGGIILENFSVATEGTMCPGVDSASKNEYQEVPLGVKAAGAWGWWPTTLVVTNVKKIRGLNLPGTPLGPCGLLWAWPSPYLLDLCTCDSLTKSTEHSISLEASSSSPGQ
jgi:hypothetical protein